MQARGPRRPDQTPKGIVIQKCALLFWYARSKAPPIWYFTDQIQLLLCCMLTTQCEGQEIKRLFFTTRQRDRILLHYRRIRKGVAIFEYKDAPKIQTCKEFKP